MKRRNSQIIWIKTLFLVVFVSNFSFSQETFEGVVVDSISLKPLPYVNISLGSNKGLITNEEGRFVLFDDEFTNSNDVIISHLGYVSSNKKTLELKDTVFLSPQVLELNEVVVLNTDDLKHNVLKNFKKNHDVEENCASFFFKQFSKENGEYINYLEAHGIVKTTFDGDKEGFRVYLKGVRKTDNLVTSYINHRHQQIPSILKWTTKNVLAEGEITDYSFIDANLVEATVEDDNNGIWKLIIDTNDYSVRKVSKNNLTEELGNPYREQTIYVEDKKVVFETYQLGSNWQYTFVEKGGKYHINHIYFRGKGALISKDKSIRHDFESEQQYLTTDLLVPCEETSSLTLLKKRKLLRELKINYDEQNWEKFLGILPLNEQSEILNRLGALK